MVAQALLLEAAFLFGGLIITQPLNRGFTHFSNKLIKNEIPYIQDAVLMHLRSPEQFPVSKVYEIGESYGYKREYIDNFIQISKQYYTLDQLCSLRLRGIISKDEFYELGSKAGIEEKVLEDVFKLYSYRYSFNELIALKFRNVITEDEFYSLCGKIGIDKDQADKLTELYKFYPPATDFIRFAVRDVFNPDIVEKYGYNEEFPDDIVKYAEKTGMDKEVLQWYWRAHWELPPPSAGFEMLHRLHPDVLRVLGEKYKEMGLNPEDLKTDLETLKELLKISDYPKYWRDRLAAISYSPLTRVDLRRIYQLGLISDDELIARLMEVGYSRKDAELLLNFYRELKTGKERDLTKSEILKLYRYKLISKDDAIEHLGALGYSKEESEFLIKLQDYKLYTKKVRTVLKLIKEQYADGVITEQELYDRLSGMNLPAEKIALEMEYAQELKKRKEKLPSKKDLIMMFQKKVISEQEFREYMQRIGYSEFWVGKYIELIGG